jgi:hypothetical protein
MPPVRVRAQFSRAARSISSRRARDPVDKKNVLIPERAMNVLVFDSPATVSHVVRAVLRSQGHRVAISDDAAEAALKLDTNLFDAIVIGPAGAPRELADHIERGFPRMPIVLAGMSAEIPAGGPVVAALVAPLAAERLAAAFRRVEHERRRQIAQLAASVEAEGVPIACRLAELTPEKMVLAGESDEFQRHFGTRPAQVAAMVLGTRLAGDVMATDGGEFRRVSRVDVRVDEPSARGVLVQLLK